MSLDTVYHEISEEDSNIIEDEPETNYKGVMMHKFKLLYLITCVLVCGCSQDWKVRIESDTKWTATITTAEFTDRYPVLSGNRVLDLPDDVPVCVRIDRSTREGFVSMQIFAENGDLLVPGRENHWLTISGETMTMTDCSR